MKAHTFFGYRISAFWFYIYIKKQFSKDQGPKMNINLEYTHVRNEKKQFFKKQKQNQG
jgi:predicted membrane protein